MPHVYYSEITTLSILLFSLLCVCVNAHICVSSLPQWVHVDHAFFIRLLSVPLFPDLFVSLNVHLVTQFTFTFLQFHPKYLLHLVRMNQGSVWTLLHLVVRWLHPFGLLTPVTLSHPPYGGCPVYLSGPHPELLPHAPPLPPQPRKPLGLLWKMLFACAVSHSQKLFVGNVICLFLIRLYF